MDIRTHSALRWWDMRAFRVQVWPQQTLLAKRIQFQVPGAHEDQDWTLCGQSYEVVRTLSSLSTSVLNSIQNMETQKSLSQSTFLLHLLTG